MYGHMSFCNVPLQVPGPFSYLAALALPLKLPDVGPKIDFPKAGPAPELSAYFFHPKVSYQLYKAMRMDMARTSFPKKLIPGISETMHNK